MIGTFIWGMAFIAQSVGMETIGPFTFQAIRCMLGVIFLFLVTFFFDWKIGMRASLQKWKNKKLWISGIICGAYYAMTRWYAENPSNLSQMFGGQLVPLADVWYYLVGGFALLGFVLCGIGTATSIRKHLNV